MSEGVMVIPYYGVIMCMAGEDFKAGDMVKVDDRCGRVIATEDKSKAIGVALHDAIKYHQVQIQMGLPSEEWETEKCPYCDGRTYKDEVTFCSECDYCEVDDWE